MQFEQFFQQMFLSAPSGAGVSHVWVYALLFVMVLVEGPIAILVAATAASTGFLYPIPVFLTASLGNLAADMLWYLLGYSGKIEWALKVRWLKINPFKLNLLERKIQQNAVKILLIAKVTNGLIVPVLIATGLAKVKMRRWFPIIFFANFGITALFVALGYFTAVNIMKLEHWIKYLALGFSFVFIIAAAAYVQALLGRQSSYDVLAANDINEQGKE
jgi:membrane protein DedA with SNARE-associated domain